MAKKKTGKKRKKATKKTTSSANQGRDIREDNFVSEPAPEEAKPKASGVKYVPNNTRCPECGAKATVTGTKQRIRQMKCGRCLHNFKAVG